MTERVHPTEALILSSLREANRGNGTVVMSVAELEAIRDFMFALQRGGEHPAQPEVTAIMRGEE